MKSQRCKRKARNVQRIAPKSKKAVMQEGGSDQPLECSQVVKGDKSWHTSTRSRDKEVTGDWWEHFNGVSGGEDRLKRTKECVGGKEVCAASINNLVEKFGSVGGERERKSRSQRGAESMYKIHFLCINTVKLNKELWENKDKTWNGIPKSLYFLDWLIVLIWFS